jgi:A/G-specific adenine glycosylase
LKRNDNFLIIDKDLEIFKKKFLKSFFSENRLTEEAVSAFRTLVYRQYQNSGRELPWRKTDNPYEIFVSEIMLQQTTVKRVLTKYTEFISAFPDFASLSTSSLKDVLKLWSGLGYSRRALSLKRSAHMVMKDFSGLLPSEPDKLVTLPGVGKATASAVSAFAFNYPAVFVETNIRALYIHFFFNDTNNIKDSALLPLVKITLDNSNPRRWYYALMDYGVIIKKMYRNPSQKSAHYHKQSPFKGSNRQKRSMIVKTLLIHPSLSETEISAMLNQSPIEVKKNLSELEKEGMIVRKNNAYTIE